jgi:hypothetical protein
VPLSRALFPTTRTRGITPAAASGAQAAPLSRLPGSSGGRILEVNVKNNPARMHGQPQIAIDPKHLNDLVFMSTADDLSVTDTTDPNFYKCFLAYSNNSGATWTQVAFPYGDAVGCGNPQLAVDSQGYCYVDYNLLGGTAPVAEGVTRSLDGGRTWSAPVATPLGLSDGPRLVVDSATDYLYAEGAPVPGGTGVGNLPAISVSKDHGLTWSAAQSLPAAAWQGFGNQVAVHDGILVTANAESVVDNGTAVVTVNPTFYVRSDQGKNWVTRPVTDGKGNPVAPPSGSLVPTPDTTQTNTDPLPWVAEDPAKAGRFAVMVPSGSNLDVYVTSNSGKTWAGPTVIAAPNVFKPAISFGSTGVLGVAWRTTAVDAYSAVSFNDGRTFSKPLRVDHTTEPAGTRYEGGDKYSHITIDGTYAYITWSDGRTGGDVDGIMSRVPLSLYR